ncbi:MAG: cyanophycin synthetase [Candidatus Sericytochromatia bacterium]
MIQISALKALRGPNRHTRHPVIFMVLEIHEFEMLPSDKIPGFVERLLDLLPSLNEHGCSIGEPGGFVQRLKQGTWAGHIIEHLAIELQCLAGMELGYGKTLDTEIEGTYLVVFRYLVESVGLKAAQQAVALFEAVAAEKTFDLARAISELKVLREDNMLGPTTWSIVEEAQSRGIPCIRLNQSSHIQLGYGVFQKRIQASITSQTSAIAVETADGKTEVKRYLENAGIPVPKGQVVTSESEALKAFEQIGTAVVVKPDVGNHGNGSTINVTHPDQLLKAFQEAQSYHPDVIVEEYVHGGDYRLLVIGGKFVAAATREPAHVVGNGKDSIQDLIQTVNADPRRGFGHEKVLTQIEIDPMTERLLALKGLSLVHCPAAGEKVYLKATANLSQGGTASDVTEAVNPEIRLMAERAAQIIGLDCVGIDALALDISLPLRQSGLKVVEVNAAPGFRMHLEPTYGQARNVAKPLVDMLFPQGYQQVPVIAITGTNGKTTTAKLITHSLKYAGKKVGLACTTGIAIDGNFVLSGDYSGPEGAGIVVREPSIDHIVLEVARGGIVRRGLGVDEVDVGVLLNIGKDHLGTDWIETQTELSLVKSTVIEVVKKNGTSVLNADDPMTMSVLDRARGTRILLSLNPNNVLLEAHIQAGGTVITVEQHTVVIRRHGRDIPVCTLEEIPITLGGIIDFNIANALAAIAALHGLGLSLEQIRNGVLTFYPSPNQNPGRMNLFDFQTYKVLVDYCHNPESAQALAGLLPRLSHGRKMALCHGTGSRTDQQIREYGMALAGLYDQILLTDFAPRDRAADLTPQLVREGLLQAGFPAHKIEIVPVLSAIDDLFARAEKGDLLVINPDKLEPIMGQIMERYRQIV